MTRVWTRIAIGLWLTAFVSCGTGEASLEVYLVRSPIVDEDPLEDGLVTHLHIRVSGPEMTPVETTSRFHAGGISTLSGIPAGEDRVVQVEGLADENGYAISRGRSLPLTLGEGHQRIELFIARVGRFTSARGALKQARFGHSAVVSDRAQLLVIGGASSGTFDTPTGPLESIVRYDPTSGYIEHFPCGQVSGRFCLSSPRAQGAAMVGSSGIIVLGGIDSAGAVTEVEFLDPLLQVVVPRSPLAEGLVAPTVIPFADHNLIAGGRGDDGTASATAYWVEPTGAVEQLVLPQRRFAMSGGLSSSGGVLFGGFDGQGTISDDFFLFDSATRSFTVHPSDSEGRAFASAVALDSGAVLFVGGLDSAGQPSSSVDLFVPQAGRICPLGELKRARWLGSAVRLPDDSVLIVGGLTGTQVHSATGDTEILDLRFVVLADQCEQLSGALLSATVPGLRIGRYAAQATALPNETIAITGGLDAAGRPLKSMEIFIPN